jgi:hypothetical protein
MFVDHGQANVCALVLPRYLPLSRLKCTTFIIPALTRHRREVSLRVIRRVHSIDGKPDISGRRGSVCPDEGTESEGVCNSDVMLYDLLHSFLQYRAGG